LNLATRHAFFGILSHRLANIVRSGVFTATIGFSAAHFQPPRANCFLAKFVEKYFFRHYSLVVAVKSALGEEIGLGSHGNVILVSRRIPAEPWVELTFIWSHNVARPYGEDVKLQCSGCSRLRPWNTPRFTKLPETVSIVCKYCGYCLKFTKPEDLERDGTMGKAGGGEWFVRRRVLT
jgi:hypothetical protein